MSHMKLAFMRHGTVTGGGGWFSTARAGSNHRLGDGGWLSIECGACFNQYVGGLVLS